ncbi:MAG: flagellar hook-length control protein FliK [Ignavibacteriae bacterium]|nr:flagellar hook-length control protein FliK [Ignavibacteriota bacterium]
MIFNPLYFSETGNNQMLVAKPGKLSSNKYLFSDIVKVVMNSDREQKKLLETNLEGIVKNQLPVIAGIENSSTQIKLTELSEKDSEKVKLDLADILPPEIAELLVSENIVLNKDQIISYISKEPLEGDLEKFINRLVGEDILSENLTKETGLFLHLEDLKSAVNIELLKETDSKQSSEKVIVQTLVVPEKSKLLSLFKSPENQEVSKSENTNLSSIKIPIDYNSIKSQSEEQNNFKPTLSVYSFKNFEQNISTLVGDNKDSLKLELVNTNLVASNKNNFSVNIPLEKISFIPSELKTNSSKTLPNANIIQEIKSNSNDSNKLETLKNSLEKEFSVTKITIVKKQDNLFGEINSKENIKENRIEPDLRKINFNEMYKSDKSQFRLLKNILNNSEASIKVSNPKLNLINQIEPKINGQLKSDLKITNQNVSNNENKIAKDNSKSNLKLEKLVNENNLQKVNLKSENVITGTKTPEKILDIQKNVNKANGEINLVKEEKTEIKSASDIKIKENPNVKVDEKSVSSENSKEQKLNNQTQDYFKKFVIGKNELTKVDSRKSAKIDTQPNEIIRNTKVINENNETIKTHKSLDIQKDEIVQNIKDINEISESSKTHKNINVQKNEIDLKTVNLKETLKETNVNAKTLPQDIKNQNNEVKISETSKSVISKQDNSFAKEIKTSEEPIKTSLKVNNEKENIIVKNEKYIVDETKSIKTDDVKKYEVNNDATEKVPNKNIQQSISDSKEKISETKSESNNSKEVKENSTKSSANEKSNFIEKSNVVEPRQDLKSFAKKEIENEVSETQKVASNNKKVEFLPNEESRKLSVKVKSNVKTITNKDEDISTNKSIKSSSEQIDSSKDETKNNLTDNSKQNLFSTEKNIIKPHHEINFDSIVKDELKKEVELTNKTNLENDSSKAHKVVKSTEIIKELSKFISNQEKGSLTFDIKPESLGKMKITLTTVENVLKASIEVDNEQAKGMVERNVEKLQEELSKNGIQLSSLNISLGQPKNHKGEKRTNTKNNSNENQTETDKIDFEEDKKTKTLGYNTYEYIA